MSKGLDPFSFLMPEASFREIDDEAEYLASDVAEYVNKTERTVRRWFESGYIKAIKRRPWSCNGVEIKEVLFKEFHLQIMNRYHSNGKTLK